jgi:hypothetical protein
VTLGTGRRTILLYGALAGLLIVGLKVAEFRFLVVEHSLEIYGAIVALAFAALGIWLGLKMTGRPEKIVTREVSVPVPVEVRVEVPVPVEVRVEVPAPATFQVDRARLDASGSRRASSRSWSSSPRASAIVRSPPASSSARTRSRPTPAGSSRSSTRAAGRRRCRSPRRPDSCREAVARKDDARVFPPKSFFRVTPSEGVGG